MYAEWIRVTRHATRKPLSHISFCGLNYWRHSKKTIKHLENHPLNSTTVFSICKQQSAKWIKDHYTCRCDLNEWSEHFPLADLFRAPWNGPFIQILPFATTVMMTAIVSFIETVPDSKTFKTHLSDPKSTSLFIYHKSISNKIVISYL